MEISYKQCIKMENKTIKCLDVFYPMENEFDMVKSILTEHLYMEKAFNRINMLTSDKLISTLVFYLLYDYSLDTKQKIKEFNNYTNMQDVDQINLKLKQLGFLVESTMNKRQKYLSPALQKIADYIRCNKGEKYIIRSIIYQDSGRKEEI